MAKVTRKRVIFPMSKGLDLSSTPGVQDVRSLTRATNTILRSRTSIKKAPGLRRLDYVGKDDGVQGAIHFFATIGGAQFDEVVRIRKGRLEIKRNEALLDLGVVASDTDSVVFERAQNSLIIHFENTRPIVYLAGGTTTTNLPILDSHVSSPPIFSRYHDMRLWYGGRPADPHKATASAIRNILDYTLNGGGFAMSIKPGDGDRTGLTGFSPTFRGDMYAYKWSHIYRILLTSFGYKIDVVTEEVGSVNHNVITMTQNDLYSVGTDGIHSLVMTAKHGAAELATVTAQIYEFFQEEVNWSNANNMIMTYDKPSNTLLLSYTSAGGSANNKIIGFNTVTKEFFGPWEDCEYPTVGTFFDQGRQTTLISCDKHGLTVLDDKENTRNGDPINLDIETGVLFPFPGSPFVRVTYTRAWLLARPTKKSVLVDVSYSIDGVKNITRQVDTFGDGFGSPIGGDTAGIIGTDLIGRMRENMVVLPFKCVGEGNSIRFRVQQDPPETDPGQDCEVYGIIYEISIDEDVEKDVQI